jgi:toxin ParE1/3/4
MTWPVVVRRRALRELQQAHDWYEAQREGLGEDFLRACDRTMFDLAEQPLRFPVLHADVRRALLVRFPYAVLFRTRANQVVVLSVLHQARDPRRWPR